MKKFTHSLILITFIPVKLFSQSITQTARGTVSDKLTRETLIGAVVLLVDSSHQKGSLTDTEGNFRITNVPLGRQQFAVSYIGYKSQVLSAVVTSGKEVVFNVELEQSVIEGKEVKVVAERRKDKPNNEMATVSARSFTFEETSRYAGSLLDPARMAMNYAGVNGASDARNDIIIRGNSPLGLLWRLNGVDIPNPNHFGSLGVTGGPISILNNNSLDKSDFLTGAFPAEYGNAIGGAFDLQMRNGNNEQHEFLGQIGFNGLELGAEGPLSKKNNASYMMNYRYSTLGVFKALGLNFGAGSAVPQYQDITFKADLTSKKAGKFSLFGIGGISYAETLDKDRDTTVDNIYDNNMRQNGNFGNNMGVVGLTHVYLFNNSAYSKLTIAASTAAQSYKIDSISTTDNSPVPWYRNASDQQKYSVSYVLNKKFSSKNFIKAGLDLKQIDFSIHDSIFDNPIFKRHADASGGSQLLQAFAVWQHRFSDKLSVNSGLHYQYFAYNSTYALEPRLGIKWEMKEGRSLSFGTGMHSQLQPMYTYFQQTLHPDFSVTLTNKNLGFTKSNHFVLAFDQLFSNNLRLKIETYYQQLYNIPVEMRPSTWSMQNEGADFGISAIDSLENKGTGKNYGAELTFEKFYSHGYYFLLTVSLYESKYKASDGIERNTAFNGNYTLNTLAGKEWTIKKKNVLGLNFRIVTSGGKRYIPIDFAKSEASGETEYDYTQAYEQRQKDYFRTDIKISYRFNGKKVTHELALDVDNVFNTKNIWQRYYDRSSNSIKTEYQAGRFPIPLYRILF
ncbi:MAG: TonB-dependent receptor [Bacteroidetes bacterium]|nr:TonB-dependent receptor [Bacteroidota bacterium]